jgi:hypothetical protein
MRGGVNDLTHYVLERLVARGPAYPVHGVACLLPREKIAPLPVLEDQAHYASYLVDGWIG